MVVAKCDECGRDFEVYKSRKSRSKHGHNFCAYPCFQKYRIKQTSNVDYFDCIDHQDKAYWLGFLITDGNITKVERKQRSVNLELSRIDEPHVVRFADIFGANIHRSDRPSRKPNFSMNRSSKCTVTSQYLWNSLVTKGIYPNKTLLPNTEIFSHIPDGLFCHFVRGVFDGDGGFSVHAKIPSCMNITITGSEPFLDKLKSKLISAPGMNNVRIFPRKATRVFALAWSGRLQIKKFADYIYADANVFLSRKKVLFDEHIYAYYEGRCL